MERRVHENGSKSLPPSSVPRSRRGTRPTTAATATPGASPALDVKAILTPPCMCIPYLVTLPTEYTGRRQNDVNFHA
jgi:hypothetical protein